MLSYQQLSSGLHARLNIMQLTCICLSIIFVFLPEHVILSLLSDVLNTILDLNHVRLNFTSLAIKYGHSPIQYQVLTEDGYILTLFRLPGNSQFPVLLMHGIEDSSDTWILRGQNSLAITLANKYYDVWCANSRGNRYSRSHVSFNPYEDEDYWKFSFHEVGYYDLPAIIDVILKETHAPSLTAIAHSQGNTAFYVLGATRPEYNEKINIMLALAPVAYLHHCPPPISTAIKLTPSIENLFSALAVNEVLGDTNVIAKKNRKICTTPVIGYAVCAIGIIFPLMGFDPEETEPSFYSIVADHFPAGTSSRSIVHYLQIGYNKKFAQYDNGFKLNLAAYNSSTPPPYDLSKVTMPIALFTGENDHLSTLPDVALLRKKLPNVVYSIVNSRKLLNHLDYVVGRNMQSYLFPHIFEVLQRYNIIKINNNTKYN